MLIGISLILIGIYASLPVHISIILYIISALEILWSIFKPILKLAITNSDV